MKPDVCTCGSTKFIGVQYQGTREDWDGVSEWRCETCGRRTGRWTNRVLKDDEIEPRYGITRAKVVKP